MVNGMKMWKGNGNTTKLLFTLNLLEILHQERRKVKTIVMEHFNGKLFHSPDLLTSSIPMNIKTTWTHGADQNTGKTSNEIDGRHEGTSQKRTN